MLFLLFPLSLFPACLGSLGHMAPVRRPWRNVAGVVARLGRLWISDVSGVPVAPPIDSAVLQRPPLHRIHPIGSPCAGRRVPRGRPPRSRIKILGLGCLSVIHCSDCAGERLGVYVAVTRRRVLPAARGARAAWPLGRRNVPAAYGLRPTLLDAELELELTQSHMTQKPILRGEVGACRFTQLTGTAKR